VPERRTLIFGFFLVLLAAIMLWLQQRPDEAPEKQGKGGAPDYIVTGFEVTHMDEQGRPWRHLKAKTMRRFESEDRTELAHPEMMIYEQKQVRWKLRAERGVITSRQTVIELLDECMLEESGIGNRGKPLRLRTRDLRIDTEGRYAETSEHVDIESDKNRLSGNGMQLWFQSPMRLKLLSEVRSHYEIQ